MKHTHHTHHTQLTQHSTHRATIWSFVTTAAVLLMVTGMAAAHAADLKLDAAKSTIGFSFTQFGVSMKGKFNKFDAVIFFDAKQPASTRAEFGVDLTSVDLGDKAYDDETKSALWLNAGKFPRATFKADKVTSLSAGKFEATGQLSIKGASQPIKAQFSYVDGVSPLVEGSFKMKRLGWKIGEKEWADTSVVADDVNVTFKFVSDKIIALPSAAPATNKARANTPTTPSTPQKK